LEGKICGYLFAIKHSLKNTLWLHQIVVGPEYRHSGIGSSLLSFLGDTAADNDFNAIELMVKPDNITARKLYSSHEYKEIEINTDMGMIVCMKSNISSASATL